MTAKEVLIKYWGHTEFRLNQEKVIESVLSGKDTLALLPIGAGKSVCFQVPALMNKGLCLVISPLISLMMDQTRHLSSKGIKSIFITSAMNKTEIDMQLTNCIYGNIKFLYLSPESLSNKLILEKITQMNINLITIDEAHCISNWGHNFRPAYRTIVKLKDIIPNKPILALTATATEEVVADIQENLRFNKKNTVRSSFKKDNISYVVIQTKDKLPTLLKLLNKIKSSVIVYTNTRKTCKSITNYLLNHKMSANVYHGGMNQEERNAAQEKWTNNSVRIMVATNAFGMGINKTDIRLIIHFDLPSSIEAYSQESGRAGRDGKLAYSFLLYSDFDFDKLKKRIKACYPSLTEMKKVYQKLMNFLQISENSFSKHPINFDIYNFCNRYQIEILQAYNILKYLEYEDILRLSQPKNSCSKIKFTIDNTELYRFQIGNKQYDNFIKLLLRSYSGLFTDFVNIREENLAKKLLVSQNKIKELLVRLEKLEILNYIPENDNPLITLLRNRQDAESLGISEEEIDKKRNRDLIKLQTINKYIKDTKNCRRNLLLAHFNQEEKERCNVCDYCIKYNKKMVSKSEYARITHQINELLKNKELSFEEISCHLMNTSNERLERILQYMFDADLVERLGNKYRNMNKLIN